MYGAANPEFLLPTGNQSMRDIMNSIVELDKYRDEELRHMRVMREYNARERERKEWEWSRRLDREAWDASEAQRHKNQMEEIAAMPLNKAWKVVKPFVWASSVIACVYVLTFLFGFGTTINKAECLRDIAACEIAVKGGAK